MFVDQHCGEGLVKAWPNSLFAQADPFEIPPDAPKEPIPPIEHLEGLLRGPDSAFYLGAAQAVVDGAKVCVHDGDESDPGPSGDRISIVRAGNLWRLLPLSVRRERTIAIPDPKNILNADIMSGAQADLQKVWQAARLGDYPEGRYELSLHEAIDQGDEAMIEKLLKRQSPRQILLMGIVLLVGFLIMGALFG